MSSQDSRTRAFTRFGTGDLQSSLDMGKQPHILKPLSGTSDLVAEAPQKPAALLKAKAIPYGRVRSAKF
jgi:hypothetical protein